MQVLILQTLNKVLILRYRSIMKKVRISYRKYKMEVILVSFQMVGLPVFRSHSKSRPFANQPLLDHSKSEQCWISDFHCICFGNLGVVVIRVSVYLHECFVKCSVHDLNTVGIWNPTLPGLWMVKKRLVCKWSGFWMGSEIRKPNHLKTDQNGRHLLRKGKWTQP